MDYNICFLFQLIKAVIADCPYPEENSEINWDKIYQISKKHNITNLIGYGILNANYSVNDDLKSLFLKSISSYLALDLKQRKGYLDIADRFEKAKIKYMPLKGILIKNLYPSPDMRNMSDCDILVDVDRYEEIEAIMSDFGYSFEVESNHEFVYKKHPVSIELHKMMIPSYNEDLYEYYGDGWKLAKCQEGSCKYELSDEDMYIYLIAHLAKHYRDSGVGIKLVIDLWLFKHKLTNLNEEYVIEQLEKLNLSLFYTNISKMIKCWFEDAEFDVKSMEMTEFIVSSGVFGNTKNKMTARTLRDSMNKNVENAVRFKYLRLMFPEYKYMKKIFPVLNKYIILLPFMWIYRLVRGALFKRESISVNINNTNMIDKDYIYLYKNHMDLVGLDIYNGRKKD